MSLKILSTTHRILNDVINVLNTENPQPFEVGCRCSTPEIQDKLFRVLDLIFLDHETINVGTMQEDNVVFVKHTMLESSS